LSNDAERAAAGPDAPSSEFRRELTWRDGFAIALVVPVALFATVPSAIGSVGTWGLIALLAVTCVVAMLQNAVYAEMAAMFPDKAGGIALYAHEAWRRYFAPIGAVVAFGYWAGWAFANAVFALTFGSLIQAQFFSGATWTISTGSAEIGLGHLIGAVCLVSVWALNTLGIRPTVRLNKILGIIAITLIAVLAVGPFLTGGFDAAGVTWGLGAEGQAWGGWRVALVFLFILGWTSYSTEICATFAPEFRDPKTDAPKAMFTSGAFTLLVAIVFPLGMGGSLGDTAIAESPGTAYAEAFNAVVGPAAGLVTIVIAASIYLVMNSATADAGRALYGIAKAGMTVKQLNHLNSKQVPARAMFCDLVMNVLMLFFVGNVLAIIFTANIGYFVGIVFVQLGFLLLRRDRPNWPRPIKRSRIWLPIAVLLALYNGTVLVVGFLNPADAGYGGATEQVIAIAILIMALILFAFRRLVQDRGSLRLREPTPAMPDEAESERAPYGDGQLGVSMS
jgi:amino acid transporter